MYSIYIYMYYIYIYYIYIYYKYIYIYTSFAILNLFFWHVELHQLVLPRCQLMSSNVRTHACKDLRQLTPKSCRYSLMRFSTIKHPFGGTATPFMETPKCLFCIFELHNSMIHSYILFSFDA